MSKLVIVESPNKIKTLEKYLGKEFIVMASVGHIVKLPTSGEARLGIDFTNWEPLLKIDPSKKEIVKKLQKAANKVDEVIIATDLDREGEAIGENLVHFLKLENKYKRIRYNEFTKTAIISAMNNPTTINYSLVTAQKTRRMLDRIIGFKLSKLMNVKLWNSPVRPSAGRVQSVALKLVIKREIEIEKFVPEKYHLLMAKAVNNVEAEYINPKNDAKKRKWIFPQNLKKIQAQIKGNLILNKVKVAKRVGKTYVPLKQAILYKNAGLSARQVQSVAQKLYEGFGDGGLISYPRTDSTRLSASFVSIAKKYIRDTFGLEYVLENIKGVAGAQDAHEAIRPTDIKLTPVKAIKKYDLTSIDAKIYTLIYNCTLQSLMTSPIKEVTRYEFINNQHQFRMSSSKVIFLGYYKITGWEKDNELPTMKIGDSLKINQYLYTDHQTNPPVRYNDGSLIYALDDIKVGRPSTFAITIANIKKRMYVDEENKILKPTTFGKEVIKKLEERFSKIIDEKYTALVEQELDLIAENKADHKHLLNKFWEKFKSTFANAYDTMEVTTMIATPVGEECPDDGGVLIYKNSRAGKKFIACANWPNCTYTRSVFKRKWTKKETS